MMGIISAALALLPALALDARNFKVLERDSGPRNYYRLVEDSGETLIRAVYSPGLQSVTLFHEVPDELRRGVRRMHWRWRALVLPRKGNECIEGLGDSAAAVYITWKRGLRWFSLKFVWSAEAPENATCNRTRNAFLASDSIVLRTGAPSGAWVDEEVDPEALFREHFAAGNPTAPVPELQGIGILTDGDQTRSVSAAEYADFVLEK